MDTIPTPQKVEFIKKDKNSGEFIIEPLYPGYGITMGNMLRRVLLSSIEGAAITSVKVQGVDHEFSGMPYVKEDGVDILLNLKQVNVKIDKEAVATMEEPLVLKINKKGEGKITAKDIKCPAQVTIANKDLLIATLTDKAGEFEAELTVVKGRGYLPIENFKGEKLSIGYIAIDAIFTPINKVNIKVEQTRVGEMTNWDKLILEIETNGAVSCEQAFDSAVEILHNQVDFLKNRSEIKNADMEEKKSEEESEVQDEK